ncbi:MAG: formate dehydrogenase accessory protein FdhE, partial [Betaproteobacteria bacterium]
FNLQPPSNSDKLHITVESFDRCINISCAILAHLPMTMLTVYPEKMRVEACDKCHGCLKVISSFSPTPPEMLPVEDLATLHLDYIARERGYARVLVQ